MEFVLSLETKNWAKYTKQPFSTPQTSDKEGSDPRERENKREEPPPSYLEGAFRPPCRSGSLGGAPRPP